MNKYTLFLLEELMERFPGGIIPEIYKPGPEMQGKVSKHNLAALVRIGYAEKRLCIFYITEKGKSFLIS